MHPVAKRLHAAIDQIVYYPLILSLALFCNKT